MVSDLVPPSISFNNEVNHKTSMSLESEAHVGHWNQLGPRATLIQVRRILNSIVFEPPRTVEVELVQPHAEASETNAF